jgi:hypothetical protein
METEQPMRLRDVFVSIRDPRQPGKVIRGLSLSNSNTLRSCNHRAARVSCYYPSSTSCGNPGPAYQGLRVIRAGY